MIPRPTRKNAALQTHTCRECIHSYDWHETGADGLPFLCRCKHYKEGRFSRFLNDRQCEKFEPRNG